MTLDSDTTLPANLPEPDLDHYFNTLNPPFGNQGLPTDLHAAPMSSLATCGLDYHFNTVIPSTETIPAETLPTDNPLSSLDLEYHFNTMVSTSDNTQTLPEEALRTGRDYVKLFPTEDLEYYFNTLNADFAVENDQAGN